MTKDNSTGKNKDFYDLGKKMFDRLNPHIAHNPKVVGPVQEPMAWMVYTQDGQSVYVTDNPTDIQEGQRALPLYATPQQVQESVNINCPSCLHSFAVLPVAQRTWVGLSEQEHTELAIECGCLSADWVFYGAALERKIKEKNEI